jgi:uncharacterized protein YjlB
MPDPVTPDALTFEPATPIPNHPRWPLLLYRGALDTGADGAIRRFAENGWGGAWVNGVFPYPHYHPDAHEVLAVVAGSATIRFGGSAGEEVHVDAGDVAVLPAGTGHQRIGASADFRVVGAYPEGQERFATRRPDDGRPPADREAVADVARPGSDPLYGADGPLLDHWSS